MEYKEYDLSGDRYRSGDDERCPVCGSNSVGLDSPEFGDGVIQVVGHCICGQTLTYNYYLDNVIAETRD